MPIVRIATVILCLFVAACAGSRPEGLPTGVTVECSDGIRQVLDCRKAFEQFTRTIRFDLGVVKSYAVGVGVGAQSLIALDSVTGDLLAHQRQMCIDYNNCILSREEYKDEMRYLRRAQLKIRAAAYWANIGSGYSVYEEGPPSPPGISLQEDEVYEVGSKYAVLNELDEIGQDLKAQTDSGGVSTVAGETVSNSSRPVRLEYSILARTKFQQGAQPNNAYEQVALLPGMALNSGDQFKIRFIPDGDGYVYAVNFDSSGKSQIIFPHPEIALSNEVTGGRAYEVPPDPCEWYFLDDVAGKETLYLVAVPFPIRNLDELISELKEGKSETASHVQMARLRGALEGLTRGVGGIVKIEEGSDEVKVKEPGEHEGCSEDEPSSDAYGMTAVSIEYYHR